MHAIVTKYMQIFCIAVFFDNVSCDQMPLREAKADYILIGEAACTAACITEQQERSFHVFEACNANCSRSTIERTPNEDTTANYTLRLVCREDTILLVEIVHLNKNASEEQTDAQGTGYSTEFDGRIYVVKVQENGKKYAPTISYITDSPIIKIGNLTEDTKYNITATVITSNYSYSYIPDVATHRTLQTKFKPDNISADNITFRYYGDKTNPELLDLVVFWQPAADMVCAYDFAFHSNSMSDQFPFITKPVEDFKFTIPNVTLNSEYKVAVVGKNPKFYHLQSTAQFKTIKMPPCLIFHNNNLSICAPHPIRNIKIYYTRISKTTFNLNVTWERPETNPDYYVVSFPATKDDQQLNNSRSIIVSGDSTCAYLDAVTIFEMDTEIKVTAYSGGGYIYETGKFNLFPSYRSFWEKYESQLKIIQMLLWILLCVTISLVIIVVLYRRIKKKRSKDEHLMKYQTKEVYLRELASTYNSDDMEVDAQNVRLYDVLGEGAFGVVRRGLILPMGPDVAVKMLKDTATVDDVEGFLQEIALMRSVGKHPNIVGIIGHCTIVYNEMMLLTEYCSEGNLLNHLRNAWHELLTAYTENKAIIKSKELDVIHPHISAIGKSTEDLLNLNSSIGDKQTFKPKNVVPNSSIEDNQPPSTLFMANDVCKLSRPTVVVNQAYDYDNNNTYLDDCFSSDSSIPKCRVELVTNSINDLKDSDAHRKCMVKIMNVEDDTGSIERKTPSIMMVENRGYDVLSLPHSNETDENNSQQTFQMTRGSRRGKIPLASTDLLNFAKQIATGMEFLATEKIVHRDLAARNVLVCADKTVKIADFGLSRDIYQDNIYLKSSAGKLPIKWLALESMLQQHYTTQSDVWSYGILLYEIVTLGNIPYPTIPVEYLVSYLKSGNRMDRPTNCSQEFYRLMYSCWNADAAKRPHFADIIKKLDSFLSNYNADELINISFMETSERVNDAMVRSALDSASSYLKPL